MTIEFTAQQIKLSQDNCVNVPDTVIEKGDEAIKEWLINSGEIDNALDYGETELKITLFKD